MDYCLRWIQPGDFIQIVFCESSFSLFQQCFKTIWRCKKNVQCSFVMLVIFAPNTHHWTMPVIQHILCPLFQWQSRPTSSRRRRCSRACCSPAWCRPAWPPCRTRWAAACPGCPSRRGRPAWWLAWRRWLRALCPLPWWNWRRCWLCLWWWWRTWWLAAWCSGPWSSPSRTIRRSP